MNFDNIIIGSGAGGLSTAICLSRAGQSVLVIEQHDVPGGWCHNFYIDGHHFSPGVHYIGLLEEGESTNKLYKGLGIANSLVFFRMNKNAYEHCWIGDERIDLPASFDQLYKNLSKRFPHEKKRLKKYLTIVKNVSTQLALIPEMSGFWDNVTIPFRTRHLGKYGLFSLKKVINWYIKDPLLQKALSIQCGDYGLAPKKASFPVHCAVMDHYSSGGFYPMGGGGSIVKSMTKLIKQYNGKIRTSQTVKRILLEGEKKKTAIGVELENGERIYSKRIISNADPDITYKKLVGEQNLSKNLAKKLDATIYSCTSLMLFLTVNMDLKKVGLDSGNIWLTPNQDLDDLYDDMMSKDISSGNEFPALFISCPTLKDPTSFDGKNHTLEVVTFISHESFIPFNNEVKRLSQDYLDYKSHLTNKIMNSLERVVPGITKNIVQKELGTPLTNEHYINTTNGCVYGTEKNLKQIGPMSFQSKSEIKGLYLCGASILSHGVAGASYSGVQTAAKILGCKQKDLLKDDSSQTIHIYDAEDAKDYPEKILKKINLKKSRLEKIG